MSVIIRPRVSSDDAFILDVSGEAFREYSLGAQRGILHMAAAGRTLVAADGDRLLGFAIVEFSSDRSAHLTAISVAERERGRGIGKKLLAAVERLARAQGTKTLELATADSNLAALELFLGYGFRKKERLREYYARGQDAVRLTKEIE